MINWVGGGCPAIPAFADPMRLAGMPVGIVRARPANIELDPVRGVPATGLTILALFWSGCVGGHSQSTCLLEGPKTRLVVKLNSPEFTRITDYPSYFTLFHATSTVGDGLPLDLYLLTWETPQKLLRILLNRGSLSACHSTVPARPSHRLDTGAAGHPTRVHARRAGTASPGFATQSYSLPSFLGN